MKRTSIAALLLCAGFSLYLTSCKKDDGPAHGGMVSNQPVITPPPAGFVFPHTYQEQSRSSEFHAWLKGSEMTNKFRPEQFFDSDDLDAGQILLKLLDRNQAQLTNPDDPSDTKTFPYFFSQGNLFLVVNEPPLADTLPLAQGTYTDLSVTKGSYYAVESDSTGTDRVHGSFPVKFTYASLIKFVNMPEPDTAAVYNTTIFLK